MISCKIHVFRNLWTGAMRQPCYHATLGLNLARNDSVRGSLAHVEAKALAHALELGGICCYAKSLENRKLRQVVEEHEVRGFDRLCRLGASRRGDLGGRSDIDLANRTLLDGKLAAGANDVVWPTLANKLPIIVDGRGGSCGLVGPLRKG